MTKSAPPRPVSAGLAIAARGLRKSFGSEVVLDGIDLTVPAGTIFALLGPNGAGKTTAVHILSTLIPADGGDIQVAGHDLRTEPDAVRGAIGVTGQFSAVDNFLTGEENLRLMADLRHLGRAAGRRRIAELLGEFGLSAAAAKTAATYSGGMRRRLDLAMTLIGDPQLIFLDEPTSGLDPRSRRTMWQIISDLAASGVTIFLTTQYLDEADQLADRIAVLDRGTIVAAGTAAELKQRIPGGHVQLQFASKQELEPAARLVAAAGRDDDALTLQVASDGSLQSLRDLIDLLDAASIQVQRLSIHTPDLDDVFFAFTGGPDSQKALLPMTAMSYAVTDSATMLRRNLRHLLRYPAMTAMLIGVPVVFLLIFVYIFGGTLGAGLGHAADSRAAYIRYVTPGILLLTVAAVGPGDVGCDRHGHDDRNHRAVPHHAHCEGQCAYRPRAGERDHGRYSGSRFSPGSRCWSASARSLVRWRGLLCWGC